MNWKLIGKYTVPTLVFTLGAFILLNVFNNYSDIKTNNKKQIGQTATTMAAEGETKETDKLREPDPLTKRQIKEDYGKLPLTFEANEGQVDSQVQYLSRGDGYNLFLTGTEAVIALRPSVKTDDSAAAKNEAEPTNQEQSVLRMKLVGASAAPEVKGLEPQSGKSNYFLGNDRQKWRTNVNHYARVEYTNVYPGVNAVYYGKQRQLEYDFVVAPGINPDIIKLSFEGAQDLSIDASGDLILRTANGDLRQQKPFIYQETNGIKQEIAGRYKINDEHEIGFELEAYDTTKTLVIDPVIVYSTYLGGSGDDVGYGIAVDSSGNAYITGYTTSINFPTVNSRSPGDDFQDVFVTKINAAGSALVYSTYLGGARYEQGRSIALDSSGNVYVTGYTASGNYPTVNPIPRPLQESVQGNIDAFITKLDSSGSSLVYSTYLGGSAFEEGRGIAVDSLGNAYVTGQTDSADFPTKNALQPTFGGYHAGGDAFVTKINSSGSAFVYSTFLGGYSYDDARGIAVDSSGNAYITGGTHSPNFPTANAFQSTMGSVCNYGPIAHCFDAFVTKLNPSGSAFIYSTFLGGNGAEEGNSIAVDSSGNAYVTGGASSANFPTVNPIQPTHFPGGAWVPQANAFVTKFNIAGTPVYSTFLGGGGSGSGIAVDSSGNAYVTGRTKGDSVFPIVNATQPIFGGAEDVFITKLNPAGSAFLFSTFLGGGYYEDGKGVAIDSTGNAFIAGRTASTDFPTTRPIQPIYGGSSSGFGDAFIAKINTGTVVVPPPFSISAITPNRGGNTGLVSVTIHGSGFVNGATVKLVTAGQPDIIATAVSISEDGTIARTRFDLKGKAPGVRNVVVSNPNSASVTLTGAFTIEVGGAPQVWVDIIGREEFRPGRPQTYYLFYGNSGNTDAYGVPVTLRGIPRDVLIELGFEILPPPQLEGQEPIDYTQVPAIIENDAEKVLPLHIPAIRAGESGALQFRLTNPSSSNYELEAYASPPQYVPETNEPAPIVAGLSCFNALLGTGLNAAGIFSPIPIGCLATGGLTLASAIQGTHALATHDKANAVLSGTQVTVGISSTILACATPDKVLGIEKVKAAVNTVLSIPSVISSCGEGSGVRKLLRSVFSMDPNDKIGSLGVGAERYNSGKEPLRYSIYFENIATATAPAQDVVITDQLDISKLDLDTFSLGPISFGVNNLVVPPLGLSEFTKDVDLRPTNNLIVRINAKLDKTTGLLTWRFTSLDPATMQPTEDPRAGFLPPNVIGNEGEGQVLFTVRPKENLTTGTAIRNKARIIFDTNEPIDTPEWLNTIDNSKPMSQVLALPATQSSNSFTVKWSGTDTGSGIQSYTVYVSKNGGDFNVWRQDITETSAIYNGSSDSSYAFYSVARDGTGNQEDAPTTADATTRTPLPDTTPPSITLTAPTETNYLLGQNVAARYSCSDAVTASPSCTGTVANGVAIDTTSVGTKTFTVTSTDNAGNTATKTVTYKVGYNIVALFDQTKLNNSGTAIPIKLQIANASGTNRSAANIAVTALHIMPGNLPIQSPGNAQPGNLFKFENGVYQFNLKSEQTWAAGTYQLFFSITDDPIEHWVQFRIK